MDGQYDIDALWTAMLKAGSGSWVSWLGALPTAALAGLQQLAEGRRSSPAPSSGPTPALTQALVAAGSCHLTDVQLEAELHCGRDILTSLVATPMDSSPPHLLVNELVQAIRPAASRACNHLAMDAQLMSNTLEQLLTKLLRRTKWAKRYRCILQSSMAEVTVAYMTSAGLSLDTMVLAEPRATLGPTTSELQEPAKKQNGHYYRSGKGWMTKVVVKSVHMMSQSSKNLGAVAEARASLTMVKRLTESAIQDGVEFAQALHDAVQAARPQCLSPLVWQYSYDARELVRQAGMTPSTPLLEEMLQQREELMLRVGGTLGSRLTGAHLKGLCNDMRKKRKDSEQVGGAERLQRVQAGLAKMVKQELDGRNLVPMLGFSKEDTMVDEQKQTIPSRRRAADKLAARYLEETEHVTESQVLAVLHEWGFDENTSRQNVIPRGKAFVFSDTLGAVRARNGTVQIAPPTTQYPNFSRLICKHFQQEGMAIPHTSICVNKGYASRKHRDSGNEGPSAIKTFGVYEGGDLLYWARDGGEVALTNLTESDASVLNPRRLTVFDGNRAHGTKAFKGVRYSIVLFTVKGFQTLQGHQRRLDVNYGKEWLKGIQRQDIFNPIARNYTAVWPEYR